MLNSNEPEEKDVQPSNLNSQKASQGITSNPLIPATIGLPPPFSVYTPTMARIINNEKDPPCFPQPINLVNSQLTQFSSYSNLRKGQVLSLPPARSSYYRINSVHFQGSLIWNNLANYINSSRSVCEFKNNKEFQRYWLRLFNMPNINITV